MPTDHYFNIFGATWANLTKHTCRGPRGLLTAGLIRKRTYPINSWCLFATGTGYLSLDGTHNLRQIIRRWPHSCLVLDSDDRLLEFKLKQLRPLDDQNRYHLRFSATLKNIKVTDLTTLDRYICPSTPN